MLICFRRTNTHTPGFDGRHPEDLVGGVDDAGAKEGEAVAAGDGEAAASGKKGGKGGGKKKGGKAAKGKGGGENAEEAEKTDAATAGDAAGEDDLGLAAPDLDADPDEGSSG